MPVAGRAIPSWTSRKGVVDVGRSRSMLLAGRRLDVCGALVESLRVGRIGTTGVRPGDAARNGGRELEAPAPEGMPAVSDAVTGVAGRLRVDDAPGRAGDLDVRLGELETSGLTRAGCLQPEVVQAVVGVTGRLGVGEVRREERQRLVAAVR